MRTVIIGGFLGSGKTTFLLSAARAIRNGGIGPSDSRLFVIENEVGDRDIDGKLVSQSGIEVQTLFSGCACCTLINDLAAMAVEVQRVEGPDYLFVELSGVAHPGTVYDMLHRSGLDCSVAVVVDAPRWPRVYGMLSDLVSSQVASADLLLISKYENVDASAMDKMVEDLQSINEHAPIAYLSLAGLDSGILGAFLGSANIDEEV